MSDASVNPGNTQEIAQPSFDQLQKLLDVCRFMGKEKNLDNLLVYIAEQGRKALTADRCSIFLLDDEAGEIWSKVMLGESDIIRFPRGAGVAGRTIESGRSILIRDAYNDPLFNPEIDRNTGYRTRNILCVPMANLEGRTIGCLQALNKLDGDFNPSDESFTLAFAAQAAVAIESALLYQEKAKVIRDLSHTQVRLKQKLDQLEVVRELEHAVNESANIYDFINAVIKKAVRSVGAEVGALFIQSEGLESWDIFAARIHSGTNVVHYTEQKLESAYDKALLVDGKAQIVNLIQKSDATLNRLSENLNVRFENLLAVPIHQPTEQDDTKSKGIFKVFNKPSGFLYEDLSFLQIIGAQIFSLILRKQLIDAKKRSENLASIGQLSSTIIHDLKNPISAIIGCAELLEERSSMSEKQLEKICNIIRNQANRCITMVEELLSVARGEKKYNFEILSLAETLGEIEMMLAAETNKKKVVIRFQCNYQGRVRLDKSKFMRVIFNLTNNAAEVLKASGGEVDITADALDDEWVAIRIRDNGPGIPPELSENLFQPFATFGKSKGTGLGLYIAKEIISEHGGTIELDPMPPGACFVIRLKQEK
ncbi:MAG: GAF domain-containing protein [Proteobacteria bacterium]|nr:MAG: GAF domain-containing protein [Pseudomonadota bacterium]